MAESAALLPVTRDTRKPGDGNKLNICASSKAAGVVLLWHLAILLGYRMIYNVDIFMQVDNVIHHVYLLLAFMTVLSITAALSPIIGMLADIKLSRYKAVLCSSYFIAIEASVLLFSFICVIVILAQHASYAASDGERIKAMILIFALLTIMVISFVVFLINGFHFGLDQLQSSRTEDVILFIHWYVWIDYLSTFITELQWNLFLYDSRYWEYTDAVRITGGCVVVSITILTIVLLVASLCVVSHRRVWFLLEPPGLSPYKLVYGVLKFAFQHKVPVRRSAFTFCEDKFPSRLDLGKQKYGGPFTTSQVEDVKAFLGILKVLFSVGPVFFLQTIIPATLPAFTRHSNFFVLILGNNSRHVVHIEGIARHIFISNGLLSPLLVVISLPLYLCFIRQRILYHIPGMLKRIGIGLFFITLSLLCAFVMDYVVHAKKTEYANCMFHAFKGATMWHRIDSNATDYPTPFLFQNVYFLIPQYILSSLSNMLIDIAVLEFVCSQSPYNMKGMVFGLFFLTKHFCKALTLVSISSFAVTWNGSFPLSCCSTFYLMHTIIAVFSLVLFWCVTRRYKYRNTNEPSNVYRYAEEYYSKTQQ